MDDIPDEKILLIRKFGLIIFENDGIVFQKSIRIIKRKGIHSLSVKKAIINRCTKTYDKENKKPVVHQYLSRVKDWLCLIDAHIVGELFFLFHNSIIMV